jgi:hypothetical protein
VLAACDFVAIVVFVTIGLISHHRGFGPAAYARDVLPLAGGWFGAAALFGLYRGGGLRAGTASWAVGIPAGVLVRALVLGKPLDGSEAAFLGVCLATIGVLVLALRGALALVAKSTRAPAIALARPSSGRR